MYICKNYKNFHCQLLIICHMFAIKPFSPFKNKLPHESIISKQRELRTLLRTYREIKTQ